MRFANGLLNWKQGVVNTAIQPSSTPLLPNNRMQPTTSSVRSFLAAASGSGCGAALGGTNFTPRHLPGLLKLKEHCNARV